MAHAGFFVKLGHLVRWFFARRGWQWLVLLAAGLAALIALGYAVENWRGKRAWERCRGELEARGAKLDWADFIPPPVPDDQNLFKAPGITEWFVRDPRIETGPNELQRRLQAGLPALMKTQFASTNLLLLASVDVVSADTAQDSDEVWQLATPAARERAQRLVSNAIGPVATSAHNYLLLVPPAEMLKPATIRVRTDHPLTAERLRALFPEAKELPGTARLEVVSMGGSSFQIWLAPPAGIAAADYLAWSEPAAADLDLIRQAATRPYARIEDSYERSYAVPTPNYVAIRTVAQTVSQRAQSYLLLGKPDLAWRELALIHDLGRILGAGPETKSTTLVSAMIQVAITGLYVSTVADGLRRHAWQESQLIAIGAQLKNKDLLALFVKATEYERAASCQMLVANQPGELDDYYSTPASQQARGVARLRNPRPWADRLTPRGWRYQNLAAIMAREQQLLENVDLSNHTLAAHKVEALKHELRSHTRHWSPYTSLAAITLPNFSRAAQNSARTQTQVDQARIACALERFRLAQGQNPESLSALVPQFIDDLPRDIVNGRALIYRRKSEGSFLLYSVGWNEKDDGGVAGQTPNDGDWVWSYPDWRAK